MIENAPRRHAFECAGQFSDAAVFRIHNHVQISGHQDIRYEFEGPLLPQRGARIDERFTACWLREDGQASSDVPGQVVQRAW